MKSIDKFVMYDTESIDNINNVMIFVLDSENRICGKEIVVEDGRITEIHTQSKIIKEIPSPVLTDVYVDYEKVGHLQPGREYGGGSCLELDGNYYSVLSLPTVFKGKNLMFRRAGNVC